MVQAEGHDGLQRRALYYCPTDKQDCVSLKNGGTIFEIA